MRPTNAKLHAEREGHYDCAREIFTRSVKDTIKPEDLRKTLNRTERRESSAVFLWTSVSSVDQCASVSRRCSCRG